MRTPKEVDFVVDEEAMGDISEYYIQVTPTPEPTIDPELIAEDEEDFGFPEDL